MMFYTRSSKTKDGDKRMDKDITDECKQKEMMLITAELNLLLLFSC